MASDDYLGLGDTRVPSYKELGEKDRNLYDLAIGVAKEGNAYSPGGAREAVFRFTQGIDFTLHSRNLGVLAAIKDAEWRREVNVLRFLKDKKLRK
jgi:hypothetical protein